MTTSKMISFKSDIICKLMGEKKLNMHIKWPVHKHIGG